MHNIWWKFEIIQQNKISSVNLFFLWIDLLNYMGFICICIMSIYLRSNFWQLCDWWWIYMFLLIFYYKSTFIFVLTQRDFWGIYLCWTTQTNGFFSYFIVVRNVCCDLNNSFIHFFFIIFFVIICLYSLMSIWSHCKFT